MQRRQMLAMGALAALGGHAQLRAAGQAAGERPGAVPSPWGVQSFSYSARLAREHDLRDPLSFLRFCRERGAGGVQTSIPLLPEPQVRELRRTLDETGTWLEGSVRLPRDAADLDRFTADLRAARAAGASVVRTVMLSGRRYETFGSADEYRRFKASSTEALLRAAPIVEREKLRLAVENHKDLRAEELVELLRQVGSEWIGVTIDTGNNLALLEAPLTTVEALAPFAMSVHLKDMAVDEHPEGFLLSEVPFGHGFLDLPRIVAILRKQRPELRFSIEMATRDPLTVPCLTERYWATFETLPAKVLARMLALVRERKEGRPLPRVAALTPEDRLQREDENVRACLDYATGRLNKLQ